MGMFDYINYTTKCPSCGEELKGFQSKDGPCTLSTLEPYDVKNFYTSCSNCHTWVEASVDAEVEKIVKKCEITFITDQQKFK